MFLIYKCLVELFLFIEGPHYIIGKYSKLIYQINMTNIFNIVNIYI